MLQINHRQEALIHFLVQHAKDTLERETHKIKITWNRGLIWNAFAAHEWKKLPKHEKVMSSNSKICDCDEKNTEVRCYFEKVANRRTTEEMSETEREKLHVRNCRKLVRGFKELSTCLEDLGGSVWIIASIPSRAVDDVDAAYGAAADVLAADMDKRGVCLASLLRSNQQFVDLDKNQGLSRSLQGSNSMQEYIANHQQEDATNRRNQTGAYRRLDAQNDVRDMLKKHLSRANISLTAKGRIPHGCWKNCTIANWPTTARPITVLKDFSIDECDKIMLVADQLSIICDHSATVSDSDPVSESESRLSLPARGETLEFDCVLI
jgi:hypothetical protein